MRRFRTGLAGLALAAAITGGATLTAGAAPPEDATRGSSAPVVDELPNAAEEKRRALREAALKQVIAGKAKPAKRGASTVVKLDSKAPGGEDQYVELAREKTDRIFVVLAEFGDTRHPSYPDQDTDPETPGPATWNGPLRNKIPAPDRSKDNSTVWQPNYGRDHYQQLYFGEGEGVESLKTYYERQSSGRYSVDGLVTDWVKVQYNEARYGRSGGYPCASNVCSNTWALISDAVNAWVADRRAAGQTDEQIKAALADYDEWDRNDYDDDGNFNEADSHPQPIYKLDGQPWRGRIQTYDAPFSLEKADSFTLHDQSTDQAAYIRGQAPQPVFDDRRSYWNAAQPNIGVKVPNAGVRMQVRSASGTSMTVRISSTK